MKDLESPRPSVSVARGAGYLAADRILSTVVGVASFALIARLITRSDMGQLTIILLVVSVAQLLTGVGLKATATKYVAFSSPRPRMRRCDKLVTNVSS
jgi:O-antigen/teichoic acid export membrane protein